MCFRGGSLFHAAGPGPNLVTLAGTLMTVFLLLGLLRRQKQGLGNIGFESSLVLVLYVAAIAGSAFV